MWPMDAAALVRDVRDRSGLSLRALAERAGTSHSTLSAYEVGRVTPGFDTLDRIVRAAGFAIEVDATARVRGSDRLPRGEELAQVLELAARFPARHAAALDASVFGRR